MSSWGTVKEKFWLSLGVDAAEEKKPKRDAGEPIFGVLEALRVREEGVAVAEEFVGASEMLLPRENHRVIGLPSEAGDMVGDVIVTTGVSAGLLGPRVLLSPVKAMSTEEWRRWPSCAGGIVVESESTV